MDYEQISKSIAELSKRLDRIAAAEKLRLARIKMRARLMDAYLRRLTAYLWN